MKKRSLKSLNVRMNVSPSSGTSYRQNLIPNVFMRTPIWNVLLTFSNFPSNGKGAHAPQIKVSWVVLPKTENTNRKSWKRVTSWADLVTTLCFAGNHRVERTLDDEAGGRRLPECEEDQATSPGDWVRRRHTDTEKTEDVWCLVLVEYVQ